MTRTLSLCLAFVMLCAFCGSVSAKSLIALVVGNNNYPLAPLANPVNDANAIALKLRGMGYSTSVLENANRTEIEAALDEFSLLADSAEKAIFFYAGHAIQVGGINYLVPVGAKLVTQRDLRKLIPLDDVMLELGRVKSLGVAILDACRDNPFANSMDERTRSGITGRGLSRNTSVYGNSVVAYATAANSTAADGQSRHSPFTAALLNHIETPDIDVRLMFGLVKEEVWKKTSGRQRPYLYESLGRAQYLYNAPPAQLPRDVTAQQLSALDQKMEKLRSAITRRDLAGVVKLSKALGEHKPYIEYIFNTFDRVEFTLSTPTEIGGEAAALSVLSIKKLVRANGNVGIPAKNVASIQLRSELLDSGWSKVMW